MNSLYFGTSFVAGIVSFLSPCVLPIIPGYLAYLGGSYEADAPDKQRSIFINAIFFVLGFSTVFALLGVLLQTVLLTLGHTVQTWLSYFGGALIIVFGLYLTRLIRIPFLDADRTIAVKRKFTSRHLTSFVFGVAFAAGWTSCVGPVLGSILALAASAPVSAFALLFAYAIGLGVPFLIVGLFTAQAGRLAERYAKIASYINVAFGIILILLGILVFTGNLGNIGGFI